MKQVERLMSKCVLGAWTLWAAMVAMPDASLAQSIPRDKARQEFGARPADPGNWLLGRWSAGALFPCSQLDSFEFAMLSKLLAHVGQMKDNVSISYTYISDFKINGNTIIAALEEPNSIYGGQVVAKRLDQDRISLTTKFGDLALRRCP
jgi:hypothetical protein